MLTRLKNRWKVNSFNLVLIICTFALGGSTCARLGESIMNFTSLEIGFIWWFIYVILISLLWPICVLLISIPLGQYLFFRKYIQRIVGKLSRKIKSSQTKIAIFASGSGSNAENIILFSKQTRLFSVPLLVTNNPYGGIWKISKKYSVPCILVTKEELAKPDSITTYLKNIEIEWVVLAGFLKKIPSPIISGFNGKIINIHPALLPEFGGTGMFGSRVHQAVISAGKKESGITIHWVDEHYDNGDIIFTAKCDVLPDDTSDTLEERVRTLEILHYPTVIADCIKKQTVR